MFTIHIWRVPNFDHINFTHIIKSSEILKINMEVDERWWEYEIIHVHVHATKIHTCTKNLPHLYVYYYDNIVPLPAHPINIKMLNMSFNMHVALPHVCFKLKRKYIYLIYTHILACTHVITIWSLLILFQSLLFYLLPKTPRPCKGWWSSNENTGISFSF